MPVYIYELPLIHSCSRPLPIIGLVIFYCFAIMLILSYINKHACIVDKSKIYALFNLSYLSDRRNAGKQGGTGQVEANVCLVRQGQEVYDGSKVSGFVELFRLLRKCGVSTSVRHHLELVLHVWNHVDPKDQN